MRKTISFLVILLIISTGCSLKYTMFKNDHKKLLVGEMTQKEFDGKYYTLYNPYKKIDTSDTSSAIKFDGVYVEESYSGTLHNESFTVYKFKPNGQVIELSLFGSYPTNFNLLNAQTDFYYYKLEGSELRIEQLQTYQSRVFNEITSGTVDKDTIRLTQSRTLQRTLSGSKEFKYPKKFVYDSTLTVH
jgi:hypothetical protein